MSGPVWVWLRSTQSGSLGWWEELLSDFEDPCAGVAAGRQSMGVLLWQ